MGKSSINDGLPIATCEYWRVCWFSRHFATCPICIVCPLFTEFELANAEAVQFSVPVAELHSSHSNVFSQWNDQNLADNLVKYSGNTLPLYQCWHMLACHDGYKLIYNRHCAVNLSRPITISEPPKTRVSVFFSSGKSNEAPPKRGDPTWDGAPGRER